MKSKEIKKKKLPRWKRKLRYLCWHLSKSMRINERVDAANAWAKKNPKFFFGGTISILALCLALSVTAFVAYLTMPQNVNQNDGNKNPLSDIESIQPIMDGFQRIENGKKREKQEISSLIEDGKKIRIELDSLRNLPNKSHKDSALIYQDYIELSHIIKVLERRK